MAVGGMARDGIFTVGRSVFCVVTSPVFGVETIVATIAVCRWAVGICRASLDELCQAFLILLVPTQKK